MATEINIAPDVDDDSALGEDLISETGTLSSSVYQYPIEHGRRYHAYADGTYLYPNDDVEHDRLDLQHQLFLWLLDGQFYLAPIEDPKNILDLGTGTGIWSLNVADSQPEAQVLGIDLSPIQPSLVAPNCSFEVFNYEDVWPFQRKFDLIVGRMLIGSVISPVHVFQQAFQNLVPGGWLELQDACPPTSDDDSIPQNSPYAEWVGLYCQALKKGGRDPNLAEKYKDILRDVGFTSIIERKYKVPQNTWPKDPSYKRLGQLNQVNISEGLEGFSMRLFTSFLDWSPDEVRILLARVRKDVENRRIHAYWPV